MRLYRTLLYKAYFDKGFNITNYFKYLLLLFGWATDDVKATIIIGVAWVIVCFIVGKIWFHYRLVDTEQEIFNRFNPFQIEVRKYLKKRKV